jgi:hypothetical protein
MRVNRSRAITSQPDACAMDSMSRTPGIKGRPGKCPSKMVLAVGTTASARIVRSDKLRLMIRSMSWKYSMRIWPLASRSLGGDEIVDAGAQVA